MVLTQRLAFNLSQFGWSMFPYHYGSHATGAIAGMTDVSTAVFPYHYGSHATEV